MENCNSGHCARYLSLFFRPAIWKGQHEKPGNDKNSEFSRSLIPEPRDFWSKLELSMEKTIEQTSSAVESSLLLSQTMQNCTKEQFLTSSLSWALAPQMLGGETPLSSPICTIDRLASLEKLVREYFESIKGNFSIQGLTWQSIS